MSPGNLNPSGLSNAEVVSKNTSRATVYDDALDYIQRVRETFTDDPAQYNRYTKFIELLHNYNKQKLHTFQIRDQVDDIFRGYPDLIKDFDTFLPYVERDRLVGSISNVSQDTSRFNDLAFKAAFIDPTISQDDTASAEQRMDKFLGQLFLIMAGTSQLRNEQTISLSTTSDAIEIENTALPTNAVQGTPALGVKAQPPTDSHDTKSRSDDYNTLGDSDDDDVEEDEMESSVYEDSQDEALDELESDERSDFSQPVVSVTEPKKPDLFWNSNDNVIELPSTTPPAISQTQLNISYAGPNFKATTSKAREPDDTRGKASHQTNDATFSNEFNADTPTAELVKKLARSMETIRSLKCEYEGLTMFNMNLPSKINIVHRVNCPALDTNIVSSDIPMYTSYNAEEQHLESYSKITDLEVLLKRQDKLSFLILHEYTCKHYIGMDKAGDDTAIGEVVENIASVASKPDGKGVLLQSKSLVNGLNEIVKRFKDPGDSFPEFNLTSYVMAPYLWYYHNRPFFREQRSDASAEVNSFLDYLASSCEEEYGKVDEMFSQGLTTPLYIPFLFAPRSILIMQNRTNLQAYREISWPQTQNSTRHAVPNCWSISAEAWTFDGVFQKKNYQLTLKFPNIEAGKKMETKKEKIQNLNIYPLLYADEGIRDHLMMRGRAFWSFKTQKYVSYTGYDYNHEENYAGARFMIDVKTYHKMHTTRSVRATQSDDTLTAEEMDKPDPPNEEFALLLPPNIFAFYLQQKRWVNLKVDLALPVAWNKEAFDKLVIDKETKELVIALVSNQLDAERATDLMAGKGNGLVVLLHGGPGTGKTLTAESVAEIAEKPLYRVTCGDIGTSPADVEKYLETVLTLGKLWKCVVLLDEADVFLEQRTLSDLERNALVSVFLRVLEYYDGILVLTSNRVGTFDEAFRSRIQLTLHYSNLNKEQRKQIWSNFIRRLDPELDQVRVDDLEQNVDKLADIVMNGREIRNSITTARQLALFKKVKMDASHLKHVISVASKFENYLKEVYAGMGEDEMARELGRR